MGTTGPWPGVAEEPRPHLPVLPLRAEPFTAMAGCVLGVGVEPVPYAGVVHLGLVTVVVSEYDPAISFFVDGLGFELVEDSPALTNDGRPKRWVVVRPPGAATGLLLARADGQDQAAAVGKQAAGRVGFFLQVEDFDAAHTRMASAGVQFLTPPRTEPYGQVAVFADIAGNKWDLIGPTA
jgi:catechol 2,3-dioxygenase-like lactoylglutathione lyase family enzyme